MQLLKPAHEIGGDLYSSFARQGVREHAAGRPSSGCPESARAFPGFGHDNGVWKPADDESDVTALPG
jgi:hypothetical protein